jgi:uncharacterized protein YkwD
MGDISEPDARQRRLRLHRRAPRRARTALALGSTLVAAVLGGMFGGIVPTPPGIPKSLVVAGDPAGSQSTAAAGIGAATAAPSAGHRGRSGTGRTAAPTAASTHRPPAATAAPSSAAPSAGASGSATPSGSPSASGSGDPAAAADAQVLALVNQQRAAVGCPAVTASPALGTLATAFSEQMAVGSFFSHVDPTGKTPWDRAAADGITDLGGENIARGQQTAADVMAAWMKSPGHRANILNCAFHFLGVGVYLGSGGPWWTQDFGY